MRDGAQRRLGTAIQAEVDKYIERHASQREAEGRRLVVRNGRRNARQIHGNGTALIVSPDNKFVAMGFSRGHILIFSGP